MSVLNSLKYQSSLHQVNVRPRLTPALSNLLSISSFANVVLFLFPIVFPQLLQFHHLPFSVTDRVFDNTHFQFSCKRLWSIIRHEKPLINTSINTWSIKLHRNLLRRQTTKNDWCPIQNPQSKVNISKVTYQSIPTLHTQQTVATRRSQLLPTVPQECVVGDETEGDSNALHLRAAYTVARAG